MNVSELTAAAFITARARQSRESARWNTVSYRLGPFLPAISLVASIQREGALDLLLRCMEDDLAAKIKADSKDDRDFSSHYQLMLSTYWVGGLYENLRCLKRYKDQIGRELFDPVMRDFELVRVPLEKHQIAKDRALKEPLPMGRFDPTGAGTLPTYSYDPKDPDRSHITQAGVMADGSICWLVIDAETLEQRWISRRNLSDRVLSAWGDERAGD